MAKGPFYEPGRYWGRITRQKLGETSTGKPQLVVSFVVIGKINVLDPDGELLPVLAQYERTAYRVITEATEPYVLADLEALGFTGTSYGQFDEEASDCCDLRGRELAFSCQHEKTQDGLAMRERWGVALVVNTGPQIKPLDSAAVRKLDAMFGKQLRQRFGKKTEAPQPPPASVTHEPPLGLPADVSAEVAQAEVETGGDIPF